VTLKIYYTVTSTNMSCITVQGWYALLSPQSQNILIKKKIGPDLGHIP